MQSKPILGILGGMGPMAGVKLHEKILNNSNAKSTMGHFEVLHCTISDLKCILKFVTDNYDSGSMKENPGEDSMRFVRTLSDHARRKGTIAILGCPCNTYHAPCMFDLMVTMTSKLNAKLAARFDGPGEPPGTVKIIHMVNLMATHLIQKSYKSIGILCSSGTRNFRIYRDVFENEGVELLEVCADFQDKVDDCIVNPDDGIIVKSLGTKRVVETLSEGVQSLQKGGAEVVILGCTELPIALNMPQLHGIPLVDPMEILARGMIHAADSSMLKPEDENARYYMDFKGNGVPFAKNEL